MIKTPSVDWFSISTILVLLGASGVALLGAVLVPAPARRTFATAVSALGFVGGLVTSVWLYVDSADGHRVISDAFYRDRWTALSQVILCGIGLATSLVAWEHVARPRDDHIAEADPRRGVRKRRVPGAHGLQEHHHLALVIHRPAGHDQFPGPARLGGLDHWLEGRALP